MGKDSAGEWTAIALAAVRDDDSKEDNGVTNGETRRTIPKERSGLAPEGLRPFDATGLLHNVTPA
jgi:hypothetical protein